MYFKKYKCTAPWGSTVWTNPFHHGPGLKILLILPVFTRVLYCHYLQYSFDLFMGVIYVFLYE